MSPSEPVANASSAVSETGGHIDTSSSPGEHISAGPFLVPAGQPEPPSTTPVGASEPHASAPPLTASAEPPAISPSAPVQVSVSPPPSVLRKRLIAQPKLVNEKSTKTHPLGWAKALEVRQIAPKPRHQVQIRRQKALQERQSAAVMDSPREEADVAAFWGAFGQSPLPAEEQNAARAFAGQPLHLRDGRQPVAPPQSPNESMLIDTTSEVSTLPPPAATGPTNDGPAVHADAMIMDYPPPSQVARAPDTNTAEYPPPSRASEVQQKRNRAGPARYLQPVALAQAQAHPRDDAVCYPALPSQQPSPDGFGSRYGGLQGQQAAAQHPHLSGQFAYPQPQGFNPQTPQYQQNGNFPHAAHVEAPTTAPALQLGAVYYSGQLSGAGVAGSQSGYTTTAPSSAMQFYGGSSTESANHGFGAQVFNNLQQIETAPSSQSFENARQGGFRVRFAQDIAERSMPVSQASPAPTTAHAGFGMCFAERPTEHPASRAPPPPTPIHERFGARFAQGLTERSSPVSRAPQASTFAHDGFGVGFTDHPIPEHSVPMPQAPPAATSQALGNIVQLWQSLGDRERLALMAQLGLRADGIAPEAAPRGQESLVDMQDQRMEPEAEAMKTRWPPLQPSLPGAQAGSRSARRPVPDGTASPAAQNPKSHLTVALMHRIDGIEESLDTQGRVQSALLDSVKDLNNKLGNLHLGQPQTPQKPVKFSAPTPKRSGRSTKSKAARVALARAAEREDFTQELLAVNSDEEDMASQEPTPSKSSTAKQKTAVRPTPPIVTLDGWKMPYIAPTSPEEEAVMVSMMNATQSANAETTFVNRLQDAVRAHMLWLLGCDQLADIGQKCPTLTEEQMAAYEKAKGHYFTRQNFRIDFDRGWVRCAFNREARLFFCQHFLESVAGGSYRDPPIPSRYLTLGQVGGALDSHMAHARAVWREQVKPVDPAKQAKRARQKQINGRKRTVYVQRSWVVSIYGMEEHYQLFSLLKIVHMSGDEADGPTGRLSSIYIIIEAAWQSEELKIFLRALDQRYIDDWVQGLCNRGGRGPRRRVAKEGAEVVDSDAPAGLWRNCYSATWLATKPPWFVRDLEIIDADYDFKLDFACGTVPVEQAKEVHDAFVKNASADSMDDEE